MNIKTLSEVNSGFISEVRRQGAESPPEKASLNAVDVLFYMTLVLTFIAVLSSGVEGVKPKPFFGYSFFIAASGSMEDEIPKNSLILVKAAKTQDLKTGDNITFVRGDYTKATHKIIDVRQNYNNAGATGFQTKGVNNMYPDIDIVNENDVIGKVTFVIPKVGAALSYIAERIYIVFIVFAVWVVICLNRRYRLNGAGLERQLKGGFGARLKQLGINPDDSRFEPHGIYGRRRRI